MSKVMFMSCSVKGCKSKPYPVDLEKAKELTKCRACDPDAHNKIKKEAKEKAKLDNAPKKGTYDAGKVISLEEGMNAAPEVQEHNHNMNLAGDGVEVPTDLTNVAGGDTKLPSGLEVPVISAADAEKQMLSNMTPGQKAARTRKINAAIKSGATPAEAKKLAAK